MQLTKQEFEQILDSKLSQFATKEDFNKCATKEDLGKFATKEDLDRFATKEDLNKFVTKEDAANFATKTDLVDMESRIQIYIQDAVADSQEELAQIIAETVAIPLQQHINQCEKVTT